MSLLDCPVARLQHPAEFAALLDIYRARAPRNVLEIGSYEGGTLFHWLQDATPELVVAVDEFNRTDRRTWPPVWATWAGAETRLEVVAGHSQASDTFTAVQRFAPFDWCFIDADHAYQAVRADWELYRPLCDGVIALHDILPPSREHPEIEVAQLWREIKADGYRTLELIDDPAAAWGGIGVVFLDERAA